jgi:release factor glutamine methyltransferase
LNILEGMRWGEAQLLAEKIDNARFDADLLLAEILRVSRDKLYFERDRELNIEEETAYKNWILRRSEHEPLQYILKSQEFMGLPFYIDERVLIPRADSETLIELWLELIRLEEMENFDQKTRVADLCTGSGALAISMAYHYPKAEVVGTDVSADALAVARQNAENLGVSVQWREGDFTAPIRGERWDWVISNPPYVTTADYLKCAPEIFREPSLAFLGGHDGLDFYRRLAVEARTLLKPEGKILLEIGWDQGEAVGRLFQDKGYITRVFPDLAGRDRVILAR